LIIQPYKHIRSIAALLEKYFYLRQIWSVLLGFLRFFLLLLPIALFGMNNKSRWGFEKVRLYIEALKIEPYFIGAANFFKCPSVPKRAN
jgi:hypothetical protein